MLALSQNDVIGMQGLAFPQGHGGLIGHISEFSSSDALFCAGISLEDWLKTRGLVSL